MRFQSFVKTGLVALTLSTSAVRANELPPLEDNSRVMGELVAGEVAYQIHKYCPTVSMRKLRAYGKLRKLAGYARSLGYSNADFNAISKDAGARAIRDGKVDAYLAQQGVTKGDDDSYCRLGTEEIQKKSLTGWLLRAI